jgi:hypothetical protein
MPNEMTQEGIGISLEPGKKIIMTGRYDARLSGGILPNGENKKDTGSNNKYIDKSQEFWGGEKGKEREQLAEHLWNEISAQLHKQFGVEPLAFNRDILQIVQPNDDADLAAETHSSGQMKINFTHAQDTIKFIRILAHEMGHFYAKRQILLYQKGNLDNIVSPTDMVSGIEFLNASPRRKLEDTSNLHSPWVFTIYNEAITESVMGDILLQVSDTMPELAGMNLRPIAYPKARKLLSQTCRNIALGYNNPDFRVKNENNEEMKKLADQLGWTDSITPADVLRVFEASTWGLKDNGMPPKLSYIRILIDHVYGKGSFRKIADLTGEINATNPEEVHSRPYLEKLQKIISEPENKHSFVQPEDSQIYLYIPTLFETSRNEKITMDISSLPNGTRVWDFRDGDFVRTGAVTILQHMLDAAGNPPDGMVGAQTEYIKNFFDQSDNPYESGIIFYKESDPFNTPKSGLSETCFKLFRERLGILDTPDMKGINNGMEYQFYHVPLFPDFDLVCVQDQAQIQRGNGMQMFFFANKEDRSRVFSTTGGPEGN